MLSVRAVVAGIHQAEHVLSKGTLLLSVARISEKKNISKDTIMYLIIMFPVRLIFHHLSPPQQTSSLQR